MKDTAEWIIALIIITMVTGIFIATKYESKANDIHKPIDLTRIK